MPGGPTGRRGGDVVVRASDAVVAGGGAKAKAPKAPKVSTKAELVVANLDANHLVQIADCTSTRSASSCFRDQSTSHKHPRKSVPVECSGPK
jgi:hypothetical protein